MTPPNIPTPRTDALVQELTRIKASDWKIDLLAHAQRIERENVVLRETVARAGLILEALNASVEWELAPSIKKEIAESVVEIREALTPPTTI